MSRIPVRVAAVVVAASVGAAWVQPAGAVVGGDEADPGEWPWHVALIENGDAVCGGAVVALDLVVTAAHCVDGVAAGRLAVLAGTVDLDRGGQRRDVIGIEEHEDYDDAESRNDIALLHLDRPFDDDGSVVAVALPDAATAAALSADGAPAVVTGFGATSEGGDVSDRLLEGEIDVLADADCTRQYAEDGDDVFGASQVCAGLDGGRVDACYGDSGGPLVVPADDERSGWYLLGLVSWGAGCGRPLRPTVYTEVAAFTSWLDEHGAVAADGTRFDSSGSLRLPALGTRGKAARYPSTIAVRGIDAPITGLAVELHGLTHDRPADLDIWLQAPDGTTITLLSDVGGHAAAAGTDVVVDADGAPAGDRPLPLRVAPTDLDADDQRKGARPRADLGALLGADPNGKWHLLVADDRAGARGSLDRWTLVFNT